MPRTAHPPASPRLRVAAAQLKFQPSMEGNLDQIRSVVRRAAQREVDAILFPECATTGYAIDFKSLDRTRLKQILVEIGNLAAEHRVNLLVGTPWLEGGDLFNALVLFDREGRAVYRYAKCHLTPRDHEVFTPGNALAWFQIDGIPATALICHERRYPELVRLPVMAGARLIFHPNAGLDPLDVSRRKRGGRDGIAARAFENAVPYLFANSVGPQGNGLWSAGDSKILDSDGTVLRLAGNSRPQLLVADLDLAKASGKYALEALEAPRFLAPLWRVVVRRMKTQARTGQIPRDWNR